MASEPRRRVVLRHNAAATGTVIAEGPQVSEVLFDGGDSLFVSNDHLTEEIVVAEKSYSEMTGPELVAAHNRMAAATGAGLVKRRFRTLADGVRRCQALANSKTKRVGLSRLSRVQMPRSVQVTIGSGLPAQWEDGIPDASGQTATGSAVVVADETRQAASRGAVETVVAKFKFRKGGERERMAAALGRELGRQVKASVLARAVFEEPPALEAAIKALDTLRRGLDWRIGGSDGNSSKLPYETRRETTDGEVTYGLHLKK